MTASLNPMVFDVVGGGPRSATSSDVLAVATASPLTGGTQAASCGYADAAATAATVLLMPPGSITMYGGDTAPTGWVLCDGTSYVRTGAYAALFAAIGTHWGAADGSHFNVPNLCGRSPVGPSLGYSATLPTPAGYSAIPSATVHALYAMPATGAGGEETHTLSASEMPYHQHSTGTSNVFLTNGGASPIGNGGSTVTNLGSVASTGGAGYGSAHNIMPAHAVVNFIVKL